MNDKTNVLLLASLAHEAGGTLNFVETLRDDHPSGFPSVRADRMEELDHFAVAAVELLLREAEQNLYAMYEDADEGRHAEAWKALSRLAHSARITGWLLPEVSSEGHHSQLRATCATRRLRAHLDEHDSGQWVPPSEVAATVADLVDALVLDRKYLLEAA